MLLLLYPSCTCLGRLTLLWRNRFPASQGGGWTLIESYDITARSVYAKAHFDVNMPRNQDGPPSDADDATDTKWDDYRLGLAV